MSIRPLLQRALHGLLERSGHARRLRRQVADLVGPARVLEVGCGRGENASSCAGGYLGIDPSTAAVSEARRRFPGREFMIWDLVRQGPVPGEFDALLLCMVLHELDDRETVLDAALPHAGSQVIVLDYDPAMGLPRRLGPELLERGRLAGYLGFDLEGILARRGWRLAGGAALDPVVRWWVFDRPLAGVEIGTRHD